MYLHIYKNLKITCVPIFNKIILFVSQKVYLGYGGGTKVFVIVGKWENLFFFLISVFFLLWILRECQVELTKQNKVAKILRLHDRQNRRASASWAEYNCLEAATSPMGRFSVPIIPWFMGALTVLKIRHKMGSNSQRRKQYIIALGLSEWGCTWYD